MICFWPNFDVRKEQVSNTKREHGQTDAENPYKTATIARHRPELQHRKEQNECKICLKTERRQDIPNGDIGPDKYKVAGQKTVQNGL